MLGWLNINQLIIKGKQYFYYRKTETLMHFKDNIYKLQQTSNNKCQWITFNLTR